MSAYQGFSHDPVLMPISSFPSQVYIASIFSQSLNAGEWSEKACSEEVNNIVDSMKPHKEAFPHRGKVPEGWMGEYNLFHLI